jgi:hypothetical protein
MNARRFCLPLVGISKNRPIVAIVAETEQVPNRENSPLNSRAQIPTARGVGSPSCVEKILSELEAL